MSIIRWVNYWFLADCLSSFTDIEQLEDSELYMCCNCQTLRKSTKKFWIRDLPTVRPRAIYSHYLFAYLLLFPDLAISYLALQSLALTLTNLYICFLILHPFLPRLPSYALLPPLRYCVYTSKDFVSTPDIVWKSITLSSSHSLDSLWTAMSSELDSIVVHYIISILVVHYITLVHNILIYINCRNFRTKRWLVLCTTCRRSLFTMVTVPAVVITLVTPWTVVFTNV